MSKTGLSGFDTLQLAQTDVVLSANQSYSSQIICTDGYFLIKGLVYSDVSSAAGGVQIQQAADTSDFDNSYYNLASFSYTGGNTTTNVFSATIFAPFAKIVYTNGGVNQTIFRLTFFACNKWTKLLFPGSILFL